MLAEPQVFYFCLNSNSFLLFFVTYDFHAIWELLQTAASIKWRQKQNHLSFYYSERLCIFIISPFYGLTKITKEKFKFNHLSFCALEPNNSVHSCLLLKTFSLYITPVYAASDLLSNKWTNPG